MSDYPAALRQRITRGSWSAAEARAVFDAILDGLVPESDIAALLTALAHQGASAQDLIAAVSALRARAIPASAPADALDIVGTGGDRSSSYNVSTAAALILAGAGVKIAKHGNRSVTSQSGAADVLEALGVRMDLAPDQVKACIERAGIAFMLAPRFHPALAPLRAVRRALDFPTLFNLTGPLCNPAGVRLMVAGVYSADFLRIYAEAMIGLNIERAWIVHGEDGLDELSISGPSMVIALDRGEVSHFRVTPEDAGLPRADRADLVGGDGAHNAAALRHLLAGAPSAYRDIAVLNAAAGLIVARCAATLFEAARIAENAIDSGAAHRALDELITVSQSLAR